MYDALNVLEALDIISKDKRSVKWRGFSDDQFSRHFNEQRLESQRRANAEKEAHLQELLARFVAMKQLLKRNHERDAVASAAVATSSSRATQGRASSAAEEAVDREQMQVTAELDAALAAANAALPATSVAAAGAAVPARAADAPPLGERPAPAVEDRSAELRAQRIQLPFQLVATQTPSRVEVALTPDLLEGNMHFEHPFSVHGDMSVLYALGLGQIRRGTDLASLRVPESLHRYVRGESLSVVSQGCGSGAPEQIDTPEPGPAAEPAVGPPARAIPAELEAVARALQSDDSADCAAKPGVPCSTTATIDAAPGDAESIHVADAPTDARSAATPAFSPCTLEF